MPEESLVDEGKVGQRSTAAAEYEVSESVRITGTGEAPEVRAITRSNAIATKQAIMGGPAGSQSGSRKYNASGRDYVQLAMLRIKPLPHLDSFTESDAGAA
jgi:hypothetical protein